MEPNFRIDIETCPLCGDALRIIVNRKVEWRLVRLKGWVGPKLLLLDRTRADGSAPMGADSTTTAIHHFATTRRSTPEDPRTLRIMIRGHE